MRSVLGRSIHGPVVWPSGWCPAVCGVVLVAVLGACAPAAPSAKPAAPAATVAPPPATAPAPRAAAGASGPGASGPGTSAAAAQPTLVGAPVTVRVAVQGATSDAGVFVGLEQGYYREVGIEVEPVIVRQVADMLPMLLSGQVEAAGVGVNAGTLNAVGRGAGLKLVADKGSLTPGHGFLAWVVRKELVDSGRFRTDADVRGLTFGMNPPIGGSQSGVAFQRLLARAGVRADEVDARPMAFPDILAAMGSGVVDTGILNEPLVAAGEQRGVLVRWRGLDEVSPNLPLGLIAYTARFSDGRPDAARAFMVPYLRSVRMYLDAMDHGRNRELVIAALVKHTTVQDPAVYDRMVPAGLHPDGRIDLEALGASIDAYRTVGALTEATEASSAVDHQYVDYARERLGPYQP